ncbi:HNH endonuclease [Streptomyces sp. NBC_01800]|uniref:HNH endonuclease n=1 Tax=Streptomyces sp. NBC_01800 TaxID=2975945 RepID=UPI003FA3680B
MPSIRTTCSECARPHDRPNRSTCGADLCAVSARLQIAARNAREAARAAVTAPTCERCGNPTNKPGRYSHCVDCVDDIARARREDERRERERLAADAAAKPCQGLGCPNPVGPLAKPGPAKLYCSPSCSKRAENLRRRTRLRPEPVACRRCGVRHVPKFRDGVCAACQKVQRTAARRKSLRDAVTAKHGNSRCWHCSVSLSDGGVFEHLIPVTRGGVSDVANCRWICDRCNRAKRNKLMDEWTPPVPA